MKLAAAVAAFLAPLALIAACGHSEPARTAPAPIAGAILPGYSGPVTDSFSYLSGTSGTVVVPANSFVTSIWAHNTTGGGTFTITPASQYTNPACDAGADVGDAGNCTFPGTTITVPAATAYFLAAPVLQGSSTELADGTQITFVSTDSYVITLTKYGR
jgi:hypothetical protein